MKLRQTPVIDAAEHRRKDGAPLGRVVHADTAREIERSRDELAEVLMAVIAESDRKTNPYNRAHALLDQLATGTDSDLVQDESTQKG